MTKKLNVLCIYAEKDQSQKEKIQDHLKLVSRNPNYNFQWEGAIENNWDGEEFKSIQSAQVILLLISAKLLASDYFLDRMLPMIFDKYEKEGLAIVPIILSSCDFRSTRLYRFQALPKDAKPIDLWDNENIALDNVKNEIERTCKVFFTKRYSGVL